MGAAVPVWAYGLLAAVVLGGLAVDLLAHRGEGAQTRRQALVWSGVWIALALAFGLWIAHRFGLPAAEDYLAAYLIEKSLSVDNLFVFLVVFARLRVPAAEQHRVLRWGIVGAFVTRAACVAGGAALLSAWHGVVYVLGAFLILTGVKTAAERPDARDDEGGVLRFLRKHLPYTDRLHGHRFVAVEAGRRVATPLLLALLVIEVTDVLFAVDSIPAVFSVSREPFIVYASNVFAILGLRSLYLVLEGLLNDLKYLRYGLGAILVFAGARMLLSDLLPMPHAVSLAVVALAMAAAIVPSVIARRRAAGHPAIGGATNAPSP